MKQYKVLGTMSGTSGDGVDLSIITTDGEQIFEFGPNHCFDYPTSIKDQLKNENLNPREILSLEYAISNFYVESITTFIKQYAITYIDLIAFHGQTIFHAPNYATTMQIGNPHLLTAQLQIPVIADFRRKDMANSGQGAPLIPIYHKILAKHFKITGPIVFVNIGGVANVSYIDDQTLVGFDTGPGCALIDDNCKKYFNQDYDHNGELAQQGIIDLELIAKWMSDPYFKQSYPKSLDRNHFRMLTNQSTIDYTNLVATLTYFTALTIAESFKLLPHIPQTILVCGGGAYNNTIIAHLKQLCAESIIKLVDEIGINSKYLEAQGFGLLAARAANNLPSSFPSTTGATQPVVCGVFYPV
ncbi:anhydro-N-acetylmuramic acid kinase [Rickettsiales endosymbiont of Stachyamoeba lipophora]|uniref:anhydro-N-acetylmuramic acid kinase n=1 Tax=Rickettsiales endosymbiont of Stachyamoeba lipophora TaxID=2486578 RepID=UPI000F647DD8|nr:anhydro-N-acetylmuramic acid kinase [Rickettsiales endosymbiont of Stachyamoeba lipophora]AZL15210.1 anhydro-N-acetylmuramic acid kinase [Rickettsiales endosymbiont of Stachyamoeba lipophora]